MRRTPGAKLAEALLDKGIAGPCIQPQTPPLLLLLPLSDHDRAALAATVARLWPDIAREAGMLTRRGVAGVETGELYVASAGGTSLDIEREHEAAARALSHVADALEASPHYYAVSRDGGVRVLGWLAVPSTYPDFVGCLVTVRVASLDIRDSRRQAHDDAALAARQARQIAAMAPPGAAGTQGRGAMAAARGRR
jgi:hypothetical protein